MFRMHVIQFTHFLLAITTRFFFIFPPFPFGFAMPIGF